MFRNHRWVAASAKKLPLVTTAEYLTFDWLSANTFRANTMNRCEQLLLQAENRFDGIDLLPTKQAIQWTFCLKSEAIALQSSAEVTMKICKLHKFDKKASALEYLYLMPVTVPKRSPSLASFLLCHSNWLSILFKALFLFKNINLRFHFIGCSFLAY